MKASIWTVEYSAIGGEYSNGVKYRKNYRTAVVTIRLQDAISLIEEENLELEDLIFHAVHRLGTNVETFIDTRRR